MIQDIAIALLALIACALQVRGHLQYNKEVGIDPNVITWTIWGLGSALEAWNYSTMTGDWYKNSLAVTCSLCCLVTWIVLLTKQRFTGFDPREHITSIVICLTAMIVWWVYGSVRDSNMIFQLDNVISFVPLMITASKKEKPRPWLTWTVSYSIGTVVVLLRHPQMQDIIWPASCALLHFIVAILSKRRFAVKK